MLENINITKKLPIIMILFSLVSALVTGAIAYTNASSELERAVENKLNSLLHSRKASLENYFELLEKDVSFHSQSPLVINALEEFSRSWDLIPSQKSNVLQKSYIDNNPYVIEQKDAFLTNNDKSEYDLKHSVYHPVFRALADSRSYHDLFLFDINGNLVYSVTKEPDFATNMVTGTWKDTHLAHLFKAINKNPLKGKHIFADFSKYEPSNNKPASFIGSAVFDKNANYIGVLVFQVSIEGLNRVMQVTAGMGHSGETYLVGSDFLLRSDSRFFKDRSILAKTVDSTTVRRALTGESGVDIISDYRNISVFSAFSPISFLSSNWALIAEIDESEILQPVYAMNNFLIISGGIIATLICTFGYFLARDIAFPITTITEMIKRISRNELNTNISVTDRKDEVGGLANAMLVFKENALKKAELEKKLSYIAEHDTLTGLHSRLFAVNYLDKLVLDSVINDLGFAVMFFDLDDFKSINDTMGHSEGDRLLKEVSDRISNSIRDADVVARMGGDEFIIILPNITEKDTVNKVATKIINSMKHSFFANQKPITVTVSIGIALYPEDAKNTTDLMREADKAMYLAKKNGKNNYQYV